MKLGITWFGKEVEHPHYRLPRRRIVVARMPYGTFTMSKTGKMFAFCSLLFGAIGKMGEQTGAAPYLK